MARKESRFSWQMPLSDQAPAYEERPQQPQHTTPQQPHISREEPSQRHFSYAPTPNELRAFVYTSSPNDPPLPQTVPTSLATSHYAPVQHIRQSLSSSNNPAFRLQAPINTAPPAYVQDEKSLVSPISPCVGNHRLSSISPVSPMPQQQPFRKSTQSNNRHTRQMSNLLPINTNLNNYPSLPVPAISPFVNPLQTPVSPGSINKSQVRDGPISPQNNLSPIYEPYSPHGFASRTTHNSHAIFTPNSSYGPNGMDSALHQPGQIAHPNMDSLKSPEWKHSLCSCSGDVSTCLSGLICPCVTYGQTSYRLSQKSAKKDPTDMLGYTAANGHCMLMSFACGLWCLFPMLQRTRIRHMYKLEGGMGSDCVKGTMCCCCVAVQNEREVKSREVSSQRWAGPANQGGYSRASEMVYKPQK